MVKKGMELELQKRKEQTDQEQKEQTDLDYHDIMDRIIMDMLDNDGKKKKKKNAKKTQVALEDLSEAQLYERVKKIREEQHKESSAATSHAPGGQKKGDRGTKKKKATKKKSYRSVQNKRKRLRFKLEAQNKASGGDDEEKSISLLEKSEQEELKEEEFLEKSEQEELEEEESEKSEQEEGEEFFPNNEDDSSVDSKTTKKASKKASKKANKRESRKARRKRLLAARSQAMNKRAKTRAARTIQPPSQEAENKSNGNKNITERLAREPPMTAKQQLCSKIREKVEELKNPMEVLHAMSTPFARTDAYDSYAEESDTESVVIQKQYPWVIHSTACFTEMKTNPDGTGPDGGRFLKKPRMVFWVASKKAASKLKEEIEKGKIDLEFTTSYADYDNALRSKSAK
jgi:hypothetical protein